MTTDEKAKAYDEAIKKAKEIKEKIVYSHLSTESCKAVSEYIDTIIPELRESEDERVRKDIVAAVEMYKDFSQLRKGEICAWLEKQKENPKNAISIPADCASNAKCEDRWHKVTDSLPDNPREVLCKDEARNYFIGRYYVGEGWEISNYDDEDKPHHLNPPVSKWIDFPSEKQKEQKPIDYPYLPGWRKNRDNNKPELKRSVLMLTTHGVAEGEWLGEKWCQYRWSCELKDGEVLYWIHLSDLERLEKEGEEKQKEQKPSWKPSEEHLSALLAVFNDPNNIGSQTCQLALADLYEQLKKL